MARIVYLHQYFRTPAEGGGTRSYEFARRLAAAGFDVHMITSNQSNNAPRNWTVNELDGFTVHQLGVPYSNRMGLVRRLRAFTHFAVSASIKAKTLGADIVFATSPPLTVAMPAIAASLGRKVPLVFEVRDLWPEAPIALGVLKNTVPITVAKALERYIYGRSDHIVCLSPGIRDGVVATGYGLDKTTVIPNACDFDEFSVTPSDVARWEDAHPFLRDRSFVLYAGTLGKANNVCWLVELAHAVNAIDSSIAFVTMGDGAERESVARLAQRYRLLNSTFYLLPPAPKREVACAMGSACVSSVVLRPVKALESNSSNKFFDALAAGKPVVINYGGWQLDLLRENDAGLGLPSDDLPAAARRLVDAIHDTSHLLVMGQNARMLGETCFARDNLAHDFIQVISDALT